MDKICFFHYNNAIDAMNRGSITAINSVWLFIKNLIVAAYGEEYGDKTTMNVDLINATIFDTDLRNMLHEIRMERNSYEHKNMTSCSKEDIERWQSAIQLLIKYVNSTSETGYQFKLKQIDTISTLAVDEVIQFDDKIIRNEVLAGSPPFIKSTQSRTTDTYYVAYGDSEKSFSITGSFAFSNKFPVFSVVHNFLTRGKTVAGSEYLKSKKLSAQDLEKVYILEIIMLRAICEGLCQNGKLHVSARHKELAKIAFTDIKYLCSLVEKMSGQKAHFPVVKMVPFEHEFEAGRDLPNSGRNIVAEVTDKEMEVFYMPKMFSSHIDYKITDHNISYFCTVLKMLFGHEEFRDGQLAALQAIFDSKENHMIILPTGYGKSLIYQFCALLQPQVTIVVCPTDCLIYDQIVNLKTFGLTETAQFNKSIYARGSSYRLFSNMIYATPDVLESENIFLLINELNKSSLINVMAIDESHQVSVWGHCFDANYFTLLHQIKNEFKGIQFLLFSATASQRIKEDLEQQFRPQKLNIMQPCPLIREHIHYDFRRFDVSSEIYEDIKRLFENSYATGNEFDLSDMTETPKLTLIICNNYFALSRLYNVLCTSDVTIEQCMIYKGEKNKYNSFRLAHKKIMLTDDTNLAGINIPFLRNVLIIGYPPSKEWFYQECGRVGRSYERSNVIVYGTNNGFDDVVQKLPAGFDDDDIGVLKNQLGKGVDFSNAEFLGSFLIDKEDSEKASHLLDEIFKYVYVRNDQSVGTVLGKMGDRERLKYDKALFLLYYCGIIVKWLFSEDNTYRFYVNMNINDGAAYFKAKTLSKIKLQTGDNEILKRYLTEASKCEGFLALFNMVSDWISENGYFLRRQMFINTLQLAFEAEEMSDEEIERNLAVYFSIGHTRYKVVKQKKRSDIQRFFMDIEEQTNAIIEEDSILPNNEIPDAEEISEVAVQDEAEQAEFPENEESDPSMAEKDEVFENKVAPSDEESENVFAEEEDSTLPNNEIPDAEEISEVAVQDEAEQAEFPENEESDPSMAEKNEVFENKVAPSDEESENVFAETDSRANLISRSKEIAENKKFLVEDLSSVVAEIEECPIEDIAFIKIYIERELEYKFNKNLLVVLSMIELIKENSRHMHRTQVVVDHLEESEAKTYFGSISGLLTFDQKTKIDDILFKKNKGKVYYRGFAGLIKKILKI